jgi:DNA-directed RNA polymerase beta' subunit
MAEIQKIIDRDDAQFVIREGVNGRINLKYAINKKGTRILPGDIILRADVEIDPTLRPNFALVAGDMIRRNGEIISNIDLGYKKEFPLRIGDVVERNLRDGDIVLFNRQPTLHKGSMLAKRVVVKPGKTLRFNLASTKTFNADFDGDEMNLHVPQDYDARAELGILSTTKMNMISPQASKSNVSIIQDNLLGAYLMTMYADKVPKDVFFNICMHGDNWSTKYILDKIQHIRRVRKSLDLKVEAFTGKGL